MSVFVDPALTGTIVSCSSCVYTIAWCILTDLVLGMGQAATVLVVLCRFIGSNCSVHFVPSRWAVALVPVAFYWQ